MSNATIAYPFDPSGTLASNKITAEHQTISPPELSEFLYIIPQATPFFAESMKIVHLPSQRSLVEGVDYMPTHLFHDASLACAKPIYGSITFFDNRLTGAVRMEYQTLGGDWTLNSQKIVEILSNKLVNPRRVTWEQVADLPYAFPPIDHDWHLDDMVGMKEVVEVLEGIRDALIASGEGGLLQHIADKGNPHQVTKAQVNLGNVENYGVATVAEAQAGTSATKYLTVLRGAQLVQALIGNALDAHVNNSNNPHNTTKAQIQLGSVENYAPATQVEAETGTANNRYMTPVRTANAIQALVGVRLDAHIARVDNPHSVTKAQVQLGSVLNYGIADVVAARAGTSNELYMTPAMTREAITAIALQGVTEHIDNMANPHNVTAAQVLLGSVQNYSVASQVEAEAGTAANRYMTPLRTAQAITSLVGTTLQGHLNNSSNPHGTTKAQVQLGNVDNFSTATVQQATAGTATNLFMTPATTKALFDALGGGGGGDATAALNLHKADLANPHEVTKEQVQLGSVNNYGTATNTQAVAGTATNLYMTPAATKAAVMALVGDAYAQHVASTSNPHNVTAAQTGAYTTAQVDTALAGKLGTTAKAADSSKLDGKTYAEVIGNAKSVEVYPSPTAGATDTWTLLGTMLIPSNIATNPLPDLVANVTGGESAFDGASPSFQLRIALRNLSFSTVVAQVENYSRVVSFGYTTAPITGGTELKVFARGPAGRQPITVAAVSQGDKFFTNTNTVVEVEPTGINYLTISLPPYARQRAYFGDLAYGELPNTQNAEQLNGSLVEWVSVASTAAEETEVQAIEQNLREDYGSFIPYSAQGSNWLYNDLPILDKWGWDTFNDGILLDTDTVDGNAMLLANEASLNYTVEVEISSTDLKANGAGVIVASATIANRPFSIAVVRTPGGLTKVQGVPSSFAYKLNTVALHIGQVDGVDLGSTNGSLMWSDTDAPNDARDPATFVDAGNGWATAGSVRIKAVRAGSIITVDVSEFGGIAYPTTARVVIDLTAVPALAPLVDRPTTWGVISVRQPKVTFEVLTRPRRYRDYVRTGIAADNDKQRFYRYNGSAWEMSYLGLNNPLVRPNRLYFSDWNGVMYQSQRNGRLRPILVEAYSRENPTVVTT